ncbi:hypothetical protein MRB53_020252 [Persea americana]|uniref:Uncharacterized protein n=1 Tax=Persea americana TaxID=3435 RepID=A0ACC2L0Y5_PERAE|nr:hypothetical protein MRB53_020252 [Persea americana]
MKESMGLFLLFLWVSSVAAVTKGGFSAVHEPHFLSGFGFLDSKVGTGDQCNRGQLLEHLFVFRKNMYLYYFGCYIFI